MYIRIHENDTIIQNPVSGYQFRWEDRLILANDDSSVIADDGVLDTCGEVDTSTPGHSDCCGIHHMEHHCFRLVCKCKP